MLKFAADENLNNDIVRALFRKRPDIDVVRIQDFGLSGAKDERVLEWAADNGRILLTEDASTITKHAYDRIRGGKMMPGVIELPQGASIGRIADDVVLLAECCTESELSSRVLYLPL